MTSMPDVTWSPEATAEFERLWTTTLKSHGQIIFALHRDFGLKIERHILVFAASQHGWVRPWLRELKPTKGTRAPEPAPAPELVSLPEVMDFGPVVPPSAVWNGFDDPVKPPDNPLIRVKKGTFPVPTGGYRMNLGRRTR